MPALARRAIPRPATPRVGIAERDDDRGDARLDQRLRAGRGVAVVVARLERTYAVAPAARSPAARSAATSACGPVGTGPVAPSPTISPSRAMTQPTAGQGAVCAARAVGERDRPAASALRRVDASAPGPRPRVPVSRTGDGERRRQTHAPGAYAVVPTLSHPDSDRRPRSFTWSAPRWLRGVRGLSPPVGTFTQPRGLSCQLCTSVPPLRQKLQRVLFSWDRPVEVGAQWGWPPARRSRAWAAIGEQDRRALRPRRSTSRAGCR